MRDSAERKEAVLKKLLPPHNRALKNLAAEEGVPMDARLILVL